MVRLGGIYKKRITSKQTNIDLDEMIKAFEQKRISILGRSSKVIVDKLRYFGQLIGMQKLKSFVVSIIYMICADLPTTEVFKNICLTGIPGSGKTEASLRIASLLQYILFGNKGNVVTLGRSDLIGRVLGETAIKTKLALLRNKNKCIFIDEVYSLGNNNSTDKDSFSKECIDTICGHLSEHIHECSVIIAGYTDETNECFFASNPGLERRFPWKFQLEKYNTDELIEIFFYKLTNFHINNVTCLRDYLNKNTNVGAADIMNIISKLMILHSKDVCLNKISPNLISYESLCDVIKEQPTKNKENFACAHMFL